MIQFDKRFVSKKELKSVCGIPYPGDIGRDRGSREPGGSDRTLANLKAFFNWCVSEDRLIRQPLRWHSPSQEATRRAGIVCYQTMKIWTLWPIMEETGYPFGCLVQFLLVTAQRRDEGPSCLCNF